MIIGDHETGMHETKMNNFMRPRLKPRPKFGSGDHAGLETLTSLLFTVNACCIPICKCCDIGIDV